MDAYQNDSIDGYDVVVINYRGLAGAELKTPKLYCAYSY
jgi:predicted alpha/beta-fold hydrolase